MGHLSVRLSLHIRQGTVLKVTVLNFSEISLHVFRKKTRALFHPENHLFSAAAISEVSFTLKIAVSAWTGFKVWGEGGRWSIGAQGGAK